MSETSSNGSNCSLDDGKFPGPLLPWPSMSEPTTAGETSPAFSASTPPSSPGEPGGRADSGGSNPARGPIPEAQTDEERRIDERLRDRRRQILAVRAAFFDGSPFDRCRTRRWFEVITRSEELVPDLFSASELDAFGSADRHSVYALHAHAASRDPAGAWAAVEAGWASETARMHYILMDEWIRDKLEIGRPPGAYRAMQDVFSVPRRLWPTTPPATTPGETMPRLYRFMLDPQHAHINARASPSLDYARPPIEDLMREYPNVVLRTRQRLRGADDYRLGPRL